MKKTVIRNRKMRYGGIAVLLTLLVITVTVLTNAAFGKLAKRYTWYTPLEAPVTYDVSEACYGLLGNVFSSVTANGGSAQAEIIFCDTAKNLVEDPTQKYVYESATQLAARYPNNIKITCYDIWTNPNTVRKYSSTLNVQTGEMVESRLKSTSVIVTDMANYHRVYSLEEFFVFKDGDTSQLWAYNGEKKLASAILRAVDPSEPTVCLTNNHGEVFYDYELMYLLDDAGYNLRFIDLYNEEIPENCKMIVSYNPNTDMVVKDELSAISETEKLDAFLSKAGNSFLVFLENGTPNLPNFEAYLSGWGVAFFYHNVGDRSYRYMVQDASQSLTSDGYTIYGKAAQEGKGAEILAGLSDTVVFKNATAMKNSATFISNGDGSYTDGNRTLYSLYTGDKNAVCWANGASVASGSNAILMSLTEQNLTNGCSYVGVVASADFSEESFLQSAVYENTDLLMRTFHTVGKTYTPEGLTIMPFESTDISTVTTRQMLWWTIGLTLTPAVVVTATAVFVLIKRRRA